MKNYSIGTRLTVAFCAMLMLTIAIGVAAFTGMGRLAHRLETAAGPSVTRIDLVSEFHSVTSDMLVSQQAMYLSGYENDRAGVESARNSFRKHAETSMQLLEKTQPLLVTEKGKRLVLELKDKLNRWVNAFPELERLCVAGESANAARKGQEITIGLYQEINRTADDLVATTRGLLAEQRKAGVEDVRFSTWVGLGTLAFAGIVSIVILSMIRTLSGELRKAAAEVTDMAGQVAGAAGQVASASQSLAQGASEQAATLEETSASGEELTGMTRRNTESTVMAAELMSNVDHQILGANQTLEHMVVSMNEINASADKISRIIKVIDEIAFQTNILALNAAVEAARAGDAGMGFAVVADEVRTLAQRCAQAARDTAQLIEESIGRSGEGKERLRQVAEAINSITGGAAKVNRLIQDVSAGSREQSAGIEHISKAVAQMERVTQSSAATAEESAASSEELSAMAEAMKCTAGRLSAMVGLRQEA